MSYVDGFVIAVPAHNKEKVLEHAKWVDQIIRDQGATRVVECWGNDLQSGVSTDFHKAVKAKDDEIVMFSWVEWPDKETRDKAQAEMQQMAQNDERFQDADNPAPFDGSRMIFGGFEVILDI